MNATYDVVGLGNAIVDVIAKSDDAFLQRHALAKGAMTLVSAQQSERLYSDMGPAIEASGGSAANTMVGVASLGGKAAYMGRVFADQLGQVFRHDIRAAGVEFATPAAKSGPPTARCLIFVTPDAQRTMQTYLGACVEFSPDDLDPAVIEGAQISYLEGYLWDPPRAKEAFREAMRIARAKHRRVALTLSDAFCVDRHRAEFRELIDTSLDIVFANESEILSLWQVASFDEAVRACQAHPRRIWAITRSEKGSVVIGDGLATHVAAERIEKVVDTTGAGDLYASGFLFGLSRARPLIECARLGHICAAEVISHYGPRPEVALATLAAAKLGG
ncbi:MAG: adenosine kinase [Alphaproteobacteria bacterium]|nr:adenosine kinase [Alphaproteobacteria bacterium]